MKPDVVVAGIGMVTPLGVGAPETWEAVLASRSAVRRVRNFDTSGFVSCIGAEMPREWDARIRSLYPRRFERVTKRYARYALAATALALRDAGMSGGLSGEQATLVVGTGTCGYDSDRTAADAGQRPPEVWDVLRRTPSSVASILSIVHEICGPALTVTTACSSGAYAVAMGFEAVRAGAADVAVVGGYDFAVTPGALQGFGEMSVLSRRNDEPTAACRPFDRDRDGMVLGDAAVTLILESAEHAAARRARGYARIAGCALTSEAASLVAPKEEGGGIAETMRSALERSDVAPEQIDYVNAHGTGTKLNDAAESRAVEAVFGSHAGRLAVSSQKSMLGHSLGASGALQVAVSALALRDQVVPPTLNWSHGDPGCRLDYVPGESRRQGVRASLTNATAFGGHNCAIVLSQMQEQACEQ